MSNDQPTELKTHQPPASLVAAARVSGMAAYRALVDESERDFEGYWDQDIESDARDYGGEYMNDVLESGEWKDK